jgi:hypothetical protein
MDVSNVFLWCGFERDDNAVQVHTEDESKSQNAIPA